MTFEKEHLKNRLALETHQIISMSKVFINQDIRPENFIVLKPIDGRPLKGVN